MLEAIGQPLHQAGVKIVEKRGPHNQYRGVEITSRNGIISPVDVETGPYPNFPTDLLPQWVVFMTMATPRSDGSKSSAKIHDQIYNNRFKYVDGVKMVMGAKIEKRGDKKCYVHAGNIYLLYKLVQCFTGMRPLINR